MTRSKCHALLELQLDAAVNARRNACLETDVAETAAATELQDAVQAYAVAEVPTVTTTTPDAPVAVDPATVPTNGRAKSAKPKAPK